MTATPGQAARGPEYVLASIHDGLLGTILRNADEDLNGTDETPESQAEHYVRWLEGERERLVALLDDAAQEPHAAPDIELAKIIAERNQYRMALEKVSGDEVGNGIAALRKIAVRALEQHPQPAPELAAATVLTEVLDFLDGGIPPGDEFAHQVAQWRKRGLPS